MPSCKPCFTILACFLPKLGHLHMLPKPALLELVDTEGNKVHMMVTERSVTTFLSVSQVMVETDKSLVCWGYI